MQAYEPKMKLGYVLNTKFSKSKTGNYLVAFGIQELVSSYVCAANGFVKG
jgi:hypothetical protein